MLYDYVSSLCNSASALAEEPPPCFREKTSEYSWGSLGSAENEDQRQLSPVACRAQPCAKCGQRRKTTAQATILPRFGVVGTCSQSSRQWPAVHNWSANVDNASKLLRRPRLLRFCRDLDRLAEAPKKLNRVACSAQARKQCPRRHENIVKHGAFVTFG